MRKLHPFLLLAFAISCTHKTSRQSLMLLNQSNLFQSDSVRQFLSLLPPGQSDSSKVLFLNGINFFKNKNNAVSAIESLVGSLLLFPNASSYYELGNVYLENGKYQEALQAFGMAEKMNYTPLGNLLFKKACTYAELKNPDSTYAYVSFAVENGFVNRSKIFGDKHLENYKSDYSLIAAYNEAMAGNGDPDEILWQGYTRDFPKATFPILIDSSYFRKQGEPVYINYDYEAYIPEMRDDKFSRDVGNEFFYVAKLETTPAYTSLIYGCQSYEESGAPIHYILAIFNNKGKLLDKKIIAGAKTFDAPFLEVKFTKASEFQIQEYLNKFQKSTEEDGYENNPIVSRELKSTTSYLVDAGGKIQVKN